MGAQPGTSEWYEQVTEDVLDPDLPIVDPHHHLWPEGGALPYGPAELHADIDSGHRIVRTVFVECGAAYSHGDPSPLAPVAETAFVAAASLDELDGLIGGIVAHADLAHPDVDQVLDAHEAAGRGLFRGIRDALSRADDPTGLRIPGRNPAGKYADPAFRRGVARLGERGLTYDTWHYHFQNVELLDLARAVPGTTMVLDHLGTPLGVGAWAGRLDEIFPGWCDDIAELAGCPNVVVKLGGLAMPDNGYGWHDRDRPPDSEEVVSAQGRWYRHVLECFGADRCMFESNFPVDRWSLSYRTWWNVAKRLAAECTRDERTALFSGTASRVYRLDD